jgi:FG-GAP-like repeat/Lipase (class 3)
MSLDPDDLIPDNDSDDVGGGQISAGAISSIAGAAYPATSTWNPFTDPTLSAPPQIISTTDPSGNTVFLTLDSSRWNSQTSSNSANTQQYVAYSTPDNSQIVIGVEGTYNFSTLATDIATWSSGGSPSQGFLDYLRDAANFIAQVKQNNPNAQISLTGHSLGGAEAQILGAYFNLPTTVINAPGVGAFIYSTTVQNTLNPFVPSGYNPQTGVTVSVDIARPGDLVSLTRTAFGTQGIITDSNPNSPINTQDHWWDALDDHDINKIVPYLNQTTNPNSGITVAPRSTDSDPYLKLPPNQVLGTTSSGLTIFQNSTVLSGALNVIDPPEGSRFVFSFGTAFFVHPQLTTFLPPDDNLGIASFKVWTESNGLWSQPTTYALGTPIALNSGLQAIQFEAFNSSGQVQVIPANYSFFGIFSMSGSFSGSVNAYNIYAHSDFTGGGVSDVLWRNSTTGEVDTWLMSNGHISGGTGVGSVSSAWQTLGTGDFNGDSTSDILWRNSTTGEVDTWLMSNGHISGGTGVGSVSSAWQFAGSGYFNGNSTSDVLWRNSTTGEVDTWLMSNGHISGGSAIGHVSSAWQPIGIGDFNGDGTSDILWRNSTTGEVDTWLMSNGQMSGGTGVGSVSSAWQALGTGDFNGDGTSDILWRNSTTGEVDTWLINNGHISGGTGVGSVSSAWQFAGIGDYTGNGTSDVLWRNSTTGEVDTWLLTNGQLTGGTAIGHASSAWTATS